MTRSRSNKVDLRSNPIIRYCLHHRLTMMEFSTICSIDPRRMQDLMRKDSKTDLLSFKEWRMICQGAHQYAKDAQKIIDFMFEVTI